MGYEATLGVLSRTPVLSECDDDYLTELAEEISNRDYHELSDEHRENMDLAMLQAVELGMFDEGPGIWGRVRNAFSRRSEPDERYSRSVISEQEVMAEVFPIALASDKSWGQFSASDYTDEQFKKACLVQGDTKSDSKLPVREPNGTLNLNGMKAAAAALSGARGGVDLTNDQKNAAARKLVRLYRDAEEEPPDSLREMANLSQQHNRDFYARAGWELASREKKDGEGEGGDDASVNFPSFKIKADGDWKKVSDLSDSKIKSLAQDGEGDAKKAAKMEWERRKSKSDMSADSTSSPSFEVEVDGEWRKVSDLTDSQVKSLVEDGSGDAKKAAQAEWGRRQGDRNEPGKRANMSSEGEEPTAVLMPTDLANNFANMAANLWRKRILPFSKVKYRGRELDFNRDVARRVVDNFKGGAFDAVPFNLVDNQNRHNDDPELIRGNVEDMEVGDDGLYARIRTDERGSEMLSHNPKIGVSPRYYPDYTREHDGQHFGPSIQHVAATPDPHVTGLGPWQAVEASAAREEAYADVDTVDLSGDYYKPEVVDGENGDGGEEELSAEMQQRLKALEEENKSLRTDLGRFARKDAERELDKFLDTEYAQKGVSPAHVEMARDALAPRVLEDGGPVELSNEGTITVSESDPMIRMLESMKGEVDFSKNRGLGNVPDADERQKAQEKHDRDYDAYKRAVHAEDG